MRLDRIISVVLIFLTGIPALGGTDPSELIPTASFTATTVCQGLETEFTNNSSTQSGSIVANIWDFGDGNGSSVLNPHHVYENAGTYSVKLTVINSSGDVDDFSALVTVHPAGELDFLISSVNQCESSQFTFSNLSNIVSGSFSSYEWNFGDGTADATTLNTTHTYADHGVYTITLSTLTNNSCENSFSKTLEVHPEATVDFSAIDVCLGSAVEFTNTTHVASGLVSYDWEFGDDEVSTEINPDHDYEQPDTYTVEVTATTEEGCVTSASGQVTVHPMPSALFTVSDHCFGMDATFTNASTISAGTFTSSWTFGDGHDSEDTDPIHRYAAIGNFYITLTTESDRGCDASYSKYLFVSPKPIVNFSFVDVCFGESAEFINSSTIAEGEVLYAWDFGDGKESDAINPIHDYETYGMYDVTLSASTPQGGCSETVVKTININQQPIAVFEAKDNCLDSLIAFTNKSVFDGDEINYHWDFGNGQVSDELTPSHLYTSAQTYIVTLTAEALNGCAHTITKPVKVFPMPLVNFSTEDVCDTKHTEFKNLTSIPSGTVSYEWDFGDETASDETEPAHLYDTHGEYEVVLTATSGLGCTASKVKPVTIFPLPTTDFQAPSVCDGSPVVFENLSQVASGEIVEVLWDFGDQTNSIVWSPSKAYLKDGVYSVKLVSISDEGCKTSRVKEITVHPPVIANFTVGDVCVGESVQTQNQSVISSGILSYYWDFGDESNSVAESPSHTYAHYGVYNILLVGMSNTGCRDSVYHAVAIFNKPHIYAGADVTVSQGYPAQLVALGGSEYTWEPITGLSNSTIQNPVATPLETTTYVVFANDNNGCTNSDTVTVYVEEEFKLVASNVLTPDENGANDTWVINNVETFGDVHVRVYDRWGKLVYEQQAYQNDWRGTTGKDILPDGSYYYYITFGSSDKVYKGALTILRNN